MVKPLLKPRLLRMLLYYLSAYKFLLVVKNWYLIPLGYLGVIDFTSGKHTLQLVNGMKFKINHFLDAWAIKEVLWGNDYRLRQTSKPQIVIDIGANIGTFSILAAKLNPKSEVFSYEPSASTFKLLTKNVNLNGLSKQVRLFQKAVGGKKGRMKLYNAGPSGLRSLYKTRGEKKFEMVQVTTLKEIFEKNNIKTCDCLKIDCEGAEYEILRSCPREIFSKIRFVALEFHEMIPKHNHHVLIEILQNEGFKIEHKYNYIENNIGYIYAYK